MSLLIKPEEERVEQIFKMNNDAVTGWRLRIAIVMVLGVIPTDAEIDNLVKLYADEDGNFTLSQFKQAISAHKANCQTPEKQAEVLAAFVALGGKPDKSGTINGNMVFKMLKDDFGMAFKEDELRGDESSVRADLDFKSFVQHFG